MLEKAIDAAKQIQEPSSKVPALQAIAEAYGKLNQPDKAAPLLKDMIAAANQFQDPSSKAQVLQAIPEVEANLKSWGQALEVVKACPSDNCKVESLAKILTIHAEQQHPELKEEEKEEK